MTNSLHGKRLMSTIIRVIKSSGYDLAWTRAGRRDATKPDELFEASRYPGEQGVA